MTVIFTNGQPAAAADARTGKPGAAGRVPAARSRGHRRWPFDLKMDDRPWYYALGVGLFVGAALAGAVHYAWFRPLNQEIQSKKVGARGPQPGDPEGPRRRAQALAVPGRGQAAGARARQASPDPSFGAQHRGSHQADRNSDAPGGFHAEEVHAGRVRPEGLLLGVADRHPGRRDVPQPGALLRPDEPVLAHRQRRGHEGHGARRRARANRSRPSSSPRRSSTRATRPGRPPRRRASAPGADAPPPIAPKPGPPPRRNR